MKRLLVRILLVILVSFQWYHPILSNSCNGFKPEKIAIIGTGYVGLVSGACFADMGHDVTCIDIDAKKIRLLHDGIIPIYEPGLKELVHHNVEHGRLHFTTSLEQGIASCGVVVIAVGTPIQETTGEVNLSIFEKVIRDIAHYLTSYKVIVIKSTVPVGTAEWVRNILVNEYQISEDNFDIVSNPEFLREGTAIYDFMNPDRVVIGYSDDKALHIMQNVYYPFMASKVPFIVANNATAEIIKYASNTFLAMKISFINEIASICRKTNGDIQGVADGIGSDPRIGKLFLKPGPGFGGSCLPKDTQALMNKAKELHLNTPLINAILESNAIHQERAFDMVYEALDGNLKGKTIAILGLAFKADTDDIRYSPAIPVIKKLLQHGVNIKAYDPVAMENMGLVFPEITYCNSYLEAVKDADACIVLTEWKEFSNIDLDDAVQSLKQRIIIDMRNVLDKNQLKKLRFNVYSV